MSMNTCAASAVDAAEPNHKIRSKRRPARPVTDLRIRLWLRWHRCSSKSELSKANVAKFWPTFFCSGPHHVCPQQTWPARRTPRRRVGSFRGVATRGETCRPCSRRHASSPLGKNKQPQNKKACLSETCCSLCFGLGSTSGRTILSEGREYPKIAE